MRDYKMHNWKTDDWIAAILSGLGGIIAYMNGMPYIGFVDLLDAGWWHMAGVKALDLLWSALVAGTCGVTGWAGKKLIEENWPKLKSFFNNLFKKRPNV